MKKQILCRFCGIPCNKKKRTYEINTNFYRGKIRVHRVCKTVECQEKGRQLALKIAWKGDW